MTATTKIKRSTGVDLDELQREAEMLVSLLKDRHPGLMTWNVFFHQRLETLQGMISEALGG